jgi:hypothetical protein
MTASLRGKGNVVLRGSVDTADLPDDVIASVRSGGALIALTGAGLPAPELMLFVSPRCVSARVTRVTCIGDRGETLTFTRKRKTTIYNFSIRAPKRSFTPPLTHDPVSIVMSLGSVDVSSKIDRCKLVAQTTMTCRQ